MYESIFFYDLAFLNFYLLQDKPQVMSSSNCCTFLTFCYFARSVFFLLQFISLVLSLDPNIGLNVVRIGR